MTREPRPDRPPPPTDQPPDAEAEDRRADLVQLLVHGIVTVCAASAVLLTARLLTGGRGGRLAEGIAVAVGVLAAAFLAPALLAALAHRESDRRTPEPSERAPSE